MGSYNIYLQSQWVSTKDQGLIVGQTQLLSGTHCSLGEQKSLWEDLTVIRTLYLLHQSILMRSDPGISTAVEAGATREQSASSEVAMDTAARMMAQVASDHVKRITNIDRLPICAIYNFQLCIKHIEDRQFSTNDNLISALGDLRTLVSTFQQRWQVQGDQQGGS